jgi:hypothetical protein
MGLSVERCGKKKNKRKKRRQELTAVSPLVESPLADEKAYGCCF